MPPKQVECSICKEIVLKSKTLHIGDGLRACREHEGVEEKSSEIIEDEEKRLKQTNNKNQDKRRNWKMKDQISFDQTHCWKCDQKGISLQEFNLKCAIALEKIKLKGEKINFLNPHQQIYDNLLPENQIPLLILDLNIFGYELTHHIRTDLKYLADMAGAVQFCNKCVLELGLFEKWKEYRSDFHEKNSPTIEQIHKIEIFVSPLLKEEAKKELISKGEWFDENLIN